ncbi:hypothetical protein FJTKL_02942 [Diaporthe vaccinii]|uniref:Uncharacterized protein n=1 Tax=Diaporthe vaccinii TaxID=105482 RepID=A0ABR4F3P7_9PEZI
MSVNFVVAPSLTGLKPQCQLRCGPATQPTSKNRETVAGWAEWDDLLCYPQSFDCDFGTASQTFLSSLTDTGPLASGLRGMEPDAHRKEIRGQTKQHMGHV